MSSAGTRTPFHIKSIVIASVARTAAGDIGGPLKRCSPTDLGAIIAKAAVDRALIDATVVQQVLSDKV